MHFLGVLEWGNGKEEDEECSKVLKQFTADSCLCHVDCEKAACRRSHVAPEKPDVSLTEASQEEYFAARVDGADPYE